uniref:Uncharacterized protein n=1 Tax=Myotis myotis TaxID=51298 RepID=A0A7J7RMJ7_MYOMY|nr:hypothetical protein mMyoMyo1_010247 [Myotis myotis]
MGEFPNLATSPKPLGPDKVEEKEEEEKRESKNELPGTSLASHCTGPRPWGHWPSLQDPLRAACLPPLCPPHQTPPQLLWLPCPHSSQGGTSERGEAKGSPHPMGPAQSQMGEATAANSGTKTCPLGQQPGSLAQKTAASPSPAPASGAGRPPPC